MTTKERTQKLVDFVNSETKRQNLMNYVVAHGSDNPKKDKKLFKKWRAIK